MECQHCDDQGQNWRWTRFQPAFRCVEINIGNYNRIWRVSYTRHMKKNIAWNSLAVQWFSSVTQPCPPLCDPMDQSGPGFSVHHRLPELTQSHICWVGDAIQPSHLLSSPSPPTSNLFQHQGLFQWVSSLHQVARVLEFQLQHQSFQWILRTDFL